MNISGGVKSCMFPTCSMRTRVRLGLSVDGQDEHVRVEEVSEGLHISKCPSHCLISMRACVEEQVSRQDIE